MCIPDKMYKNSAGSGRMIDMIRIVFFDIDGTLLSHTSNSIPPSAIAALHRLKQNGILTAGCTGRHPLELEKLPVQDFTPDAWIFLNGSWCTKKGKTISEKPLSRDAMKCLQDYLTVHPVPMQFMEKNYIYDNLISDTMVQELAAVHTEPDPIEPLSRLTEHPVLMVIPWAEKKIREKIRTKLNLLEMPWGSASDMVRSDSGKDAGVRDILHACGLKKEEAMCFGDGRNDISMFSACGTSICMGNGCRQAKEAADEVCEDIDEDGICKALKRHGLI